MGWRVGQTRRKPSSLNVAQMNLDAASAPLSRIGELAPGRKLRMADPSLALGEESVDQRLEFW